MQPIEASPDQVPASAKSLDVRGETSNYQRPLSAARHLAASISAAIVALLLCMALPVAAQDSQPPSVPTGLTGTAVSTTKINLSWNASTDNVGVSGYYVYLNDEAIATTSGTTFQHLGRTPGTTYNYRVSAYDAAFNHSGWTATPVAVTTGGGSPDTTAPTVPTGLVVTAVSSTQVNLTWNASADNYGVTGYYVYLNDQALRTTKSTSFQHTGLSPGTTYNYRVSAYDAIPNHSAWTASPVSVTTPSSDTTSPLATFTSTTAEISNPERGFAQMASDLTSMSPSWLQEKFNLGYRVIVHRQLLPSANSPLPQSLLDSLNAQAALHRTTGTKMAMQFSYDNSDTGSASPPQSRIVTHIDQLKPFFRTNADIMVALHGGFLGRYGEWGYSSEPSITTVIEGIGHPSDAARVAVRDALFGALDRSTPIAWRNPSDLNSWYQSHLTDLQSFTESDQARSGIHNDCFLNSLDDGGTYWKYQGPGPYQSRGLDNPLRLYHSQISEWTTTGGENCNNGDYKLCADVLGDGALYHWRYLRDDWGTVFSEGWQTQGCFPQIQRSLGYRFQLDAISHPLTVSRGGIVNVVVDLKNVGWSRIFSARKLVVLLRNRTTGAWVTAGAGDMRSIPSQATPNSASTRVVVSVSIPVDASAAGIHDVFLSMPDIWPGTKDNQYHAVRFANADNSGAGQVWEQTNFRFQTGTSLTVTSAVATDVTPPAVNITAPAPGNTVSGSMVATASASDNFGVVGVTFYYKSATGTPTQFGQGEDLAAPYNASADTTLVSNGTYTLTAVARDAAGNTTTSAPVVITVSN